VRRLLGMHGMPSAFACALCHHLPKLFSYCKTINAFGE
jgi:hypothetical protein